MFILPTMEVIAGSSAVIPEHQVVDVPTASKRPRKKKNKSGRLASVAVSAAYEDDVRTDETLRRTTRHVIVLMMSSNLLCLLINEFCWSPDTLVFIETTQECVLSLPLKLANTLVMVILAHRVISYYHVMARMRQAKWGLSTVKEAFFKTDLKYYFVMEMIVVLWQPYPGLDNYRIFDSRTVAAVSMMRWYPLWRYFHLNSSIYRYRHQSTIHITNKNTSMAFSLNTVLKAYFYNHTIRFTLFLFGFSIVIMTYAIYILEREYWMPLDATLGLLPTRGYLWHESMAEQTKWVKTDFHIFGNCAWFISVTMATLGYGDLVPNSERGKILSIIACVIGIILMSLLVGVITNKLSPTAVQQRVIDYSRMAEVNMRKMKAAAHIIRLYWSNYVMKKKNARTRAMINEINQTGDFSKSAAMSLSDTKKEYTSSKSALVRPKVTRHVTRPLGFAGNEGELAAAILQFRATRRHEQDMRESQINEWQGATRQLLSEQQHLNERVARVEVQMHKMMDILGEIRSSFFAAAISDDPLPSPPPQSLPVRRRLSPPHYDEPDGASEFV